MEQKRGLATPDLAGGFDAEEGYLAARPVKQRRFVGEGHFVSPETSPNAARTVETFGAFGGAAFGGGGGVGGGGGGSAPPPLQHTPAHRSATEILMMSRRPAAKPVATWAGIGDMAAAAAPQCHVCQQVVRLAPVAALTAAAAAAAAAAHAPAAMRCTFCELTTCCACAFQCAGCERGYCRFCTAVRYAIYVSCQWLESLRTAI